MDNVGFTKYSEIENSYRQKFIEYIYEQGLSSGEWIATEKIHGSCLSLWTDGITVKVAKRSAFLTDNENFNNHSVILEKYKDKTIALFEELSQVYPIKAIAIFGEIFGGTYPHPDVEKVKNAVKIQGEIKYCPHNDFACFDLKIVYKNKDLNHNRNEVYLNQHEMMSYLNKHGFFCLKPLFTGTLEDCLKYSPIFQTTIPKEFGLPEIEGNMAEGVVIKPVEEKRFSNGSRVIIKNKHPKFAEKQKKSKNNQPPKELPEQVKKAIEEADEYVTENRLRNVLSKFGTVQQKDFGKLMGLTMQDVIQDYMKESNTIDSLEKEDRKKFNKELGKLIGNMIRPNFLNIIDGVF